MKLKKAIENTKNKLIRKTKKIYENFGQKEYNDLKEKYIDSSDYSKEMNENRKLLEEFFNWCLVYNI